MTSTDAAKRLTAWLDDPAESGMFTRRDIADLAEILKERQEDAVHVWYVMAAATSIHGLPADLEHTISALYTRFYDRIWKKDS